MWLQPRARRAEIVGKRSVSIARGQRSRDKLLRVHGVAEDALRRALGLSSG